MSNINDEEIEDALALYGCGNGPHYEDMFAELIDKFKTKQYKYKRFNSWNHKFIIDDKYEEYYLFTVKNLNHTVIKYFVYDDKYLKARLSNKFIISSLLANSFIKIYGKHNADEDDQYIINRYLEKHSYTGPILKHVIDIITEHITDIEDK